MPDGFNFEDEAGLSVRIVPDHEAFAQFLAETLVSALLGECRYFARAVFCVRRQVAIPEPMEPDHPHRWASSRPRPAAFDPKETMVELPGTVGYRSDVMHMNIPARWTRDRPPARADRMPV